MFVSVWKIPALCFCLPCAFCFLSCVPLFRLLAAGSSFFIWSRRRSRDNDFKSFLVFVHDRFIFLKGDFILRLLSVIFTCGKPYCHWHVSTYCACIEHIYVCTYVRLFVVSCFYSVVWRRVLSPLSLFPLCTLCWHITRLASSLTARCLLRPSHFDWISFLTFIGCFCMHMCESATTLNVFVVVVQRNICSFVSLLNWF